jgi:hypothetical protein
MTCLQKGIALEDRRVELEIGQAMNTTVVSHGTMFSPVMDGRKSTVEGKLHTGDALAKTSEFPQQQTGKGLIG